MMSKIGIMGGSFDPPHIGHLMMAEYAREELKLEKVIFLPTGRISYKDEGKASAYDRMFMTKLAIDKHPFFDLSDLESISDDYSYTSVSLEKLHELYDNTHFFFIVGADSLDYMDKWKNPEKIFSLCSIAVINRCGFTLNELRDKADDLKNNFGADIYFVDMPKVDISSSQIRERLKLGKSVRYMVPEKVLNYISKNNLYCEGNK